MTIISLWITKAFDIDNLVTKTNQTNFTQQNAGNHVFELTTRKESLDNGHDYFFSYGMQRKLG